MREIEVHFYTPAKGREKRKMDLLSLVLTVSEVRLDSVKYRGLPSLDLLNRVLRRGNGDEGFFPVDWEGFAIDSREYDDLRHAFDAYTAKRKAKRDKRRTLAPSRL